MNEKVDQRKYKRKELDQRLTLERWDPHSAPGTNMHLEVQGADISSGGIGIAGSHSFHVGEVLKIEYTLNGDEVTLPLFTEIVWSTVDKGQCRAGLRFLN